MRTPDVAIVGAGLIGLALAYDLAGRGASVTVFDAGDFDGGASWASAGMLAPFTEMIGDDAFARLCADSLRLYPAFAAEIARASGIDPWLRLNGIIEAAFDDTGAAMLEQRSTRLQQSGVRACLYGREDALRQCAALAPGVHAALFVEGEGHIENRRLGRALTRACEQRGVQLRARVGDVEIQCNERRALGVRWRDGYFAAGVIVNACGARSGALSGVPDYARVPVFPVKGQMLALQVPASLLRTTLWVPGAYLVPRDDGRLIVGATVEPLRGDTRVTAGAISGLLYAALSAVPALSEMSITETWAGLRPSSPDGKPFLGACGLEGYYLATGHYRNGVLLAPITAALVADAIEGKPDSRLEPFALKRVSAGEPPLALEHSNQA